VIIIIIFKIIIKSLNIKNNMNNKIKI